MTGLKPPQAKAYLDRITPYIGGKSKGLGDKPVVKLSSNENANGPSPYALAAYEKEAAKLMRYPEDNALSLRQAIEVRYGYPAEQIICGAGSDEVIGMLVKAYAGPGDEVLYCEHGFLMYRIYAEQSGATPVAAPENNLRTNVDALLAHVSDKTKLVFIANPNNPTGSYISDSEVARLRAGLREDIILVLDGAYAEYVDQPNFTDGAELIASSNTVITHTFSKLYGLPSLRVGWGYGPKAIIETLYKVRSPFNVAQPAISAAIAALQDTDYTAAQIRLNSKQRDWVRRQLEALGIAVMPAYGNFILVRCPDEPGLTAPELNEALLKEGVIVREVANYGLPDYLRVSIGTEKDNGLFIAALKAIVTKARAP